MKSDAGEKETREASLEGALDAPFSGPPGLPAFVLRVSYLEFQLEDESEMRHMAGLE